MSFGRLRDIVANRVNTTRPAPPINSGLRVIPVDHRRRGSITDDWEEVGDSSNSVYSISSTFDDDATTLAEHNPTDSNSHHQVEELPSLSGSGLTIGAAVGAMYEDPPPAYDLIAPSTEGYAACEPFTRPRVSIVSAIDDDTARRGKTPCPEPVSSPGKLVRRVSSEDTLADHNHLALRELPSPTTKQNKSVSGKPCYRLPSFAEPRLQNDGKSFDSTWYRSGPAGNEPFNELTHNPTKFHTNLSTLSRILGTAAKRIGLRGPDDAASNALSDLEDVVHSLDSQVNDLEPILRTYSKHWTAHGAGLAAGEIPLSARLWEWINSTRIFLLAAQGDLVVLVAERPGLRRLDGNAFESETDAMRYAEKLKELHTVMEELLPIIKSDFDLFNTHLMVFPILKARSGGSSAPQRQPPHPTVARLRRQLYTLKDQVQAHHDILKGLQKSYPQARKRDINQALQSLTNVSTAITTILTNNGSEWIQADLDSRHDGEQKVLPYADFVSLDADVLHDVAGHLREMHEDLGLASVPLEEICFTATPLKNHQLHMLTNERSMKKLLSRAETGDKNVSPCQLDNLLGGLLGGAGGLGGLLAGAAGVAGGAAGGKEAAPAAGTPVVRPTPTRQRPTPTPARARVSGAGVGGAAATPPARGRGGNGANAAAADGNAANERGGRGRGNAGEDGDAANAGNAGTSAPGSAGAAATPTAQTPVRQTPARQTPGARNSAATPGRQNPAATLGAPQATPRRSQGTTRPSDPTDDQKVPATLGPQFAPAPASRALMRIVYKLRARGMGVRN